MRAKAAHGTSSLKYAGGSTATEKKTYSSPRTNASDRRHNISATSRGCGGRPSLSTRQSATKRASPLNEAAENDGDRQQCNEQCAPWRGVF